MTHRCSPLNLPDLKVSATSLPVTVKFFCRIRASRGRASLSAWRLSTYARRSKAQKLISPTNYPFSGAVSICLWYEDVLSLHQCWKLTILFYRPWLREHFVLESLHLSKWIVSWSWWLFLSISMNREYQKATSVAAFYSFVYGLFANKIFDL